MEYFEHHFFAKAILKKMDSIHIFELLNPCKIKYLQDLICVIKCLRAVFHR
jgi:hypothetical protein